MSVVISTNLIYDEKFNLALDVYDNDNSNVKNDKAIIVIHGGGWFHGDKSQDEDLATVLAKRGYTVIVPNYRLAPAYIYPAALNDIFKVYEWTKDCRYEFDRKKIGVMGTSAGGNLAIELALKYSIPAVSWSGIIDMYDWIISHEEVVAKLETEEDFSNIEKARVQQNDLNDSYYKWFVLNYVNKDLNLLKEASLFNRVTKNSGPIFMVNSLDEFIPIDGLLKLQSKLTELKVPSMTQFVAGTNHGKYYGKEVINNTISFLIPL